VVHQIRNSLKYVASKDKKVIMADLKPVYQAINKDQAEVNLSMIELRKKEAATCFLDGAVAASIKLDQNSYGTTA
jgi:transposase-like protein